MNLTAVFPAAGLSFRFGGKIKALARVGPNNETLLDVSMDQAKEAGFNKFVIITSDKTIKPLKDVFGDSFKGIPIKYCIQKTPDYRQKPFGTGHALLSAKDLVKESHLYLSSDEIYGLKTLKAVADYLRTNKNGYCIPAYRLKNVLPQEGTVNRGMIIENGNSLERIEEQFKISLQDIPSKYTGEEFISMSVCGLNHEILEYLEKDFNRFLEKHKDDPVAEYLLVDGITNLIKEKGANVVLLPTEDKPLSLTNPEDEEKMRKQLKYKAL